MKDSEDIHPAIWTRMVPRLHCLLQVQTTRPPNIRHGIIQSDNCLELSPWEQSRIAGVMVGLELEVTIDGRRC